MKVTINYLITLNQLRYGFHIKTPVTPKAVVSEVSLETQKIEKYIIGYIPIMVKSGKCNLSDLSPEEQIKMGECPNDQGGYLGSI